MSNGKFTAWDTIHGREGTVYIIIEGVQDELGNVESAKVDEEREIQDVPVMGIRHMQHKPGGKNITGSLSLYYTNSALRSRLLQEKETRRPTKMDMLIVNDDPQSDVGRQSILVTDIIFEGFTVAQVDGGEEILKEELSFMAGGYKVIEEFKRR